MKQYYNLFEKSNLSDLFIIEKKKYIDLAVEYNIEIIDKFSIYELQGFKKISQTIMKNITNNIFIKEVAICKWKNNLNLDGITVVLDHLSDYGNIGTIIRNCKCFNIQSIIILTNNNIWNHKLIEASRGLIFDLKPYISYTDDVLKYFNNIYITDVCKKSTEINIQGKTAIIFGNETDGVRKSLYALSKGIINIPCQYESLNVSVANGIILSQIFMKHFIA